MRITTNTKQIWTQLALGRLPQICMGLFLSAAAMTASAQVDDIALTFTVNTANAPILNGQMWESFGGSLPRTSSTALPVPSKTANQDGSYTSIYSFTESTSNPPLAFFGLGTLTDPIGSTTAGQNHVVMFANSAAASGVLGSTWDSLFPTFSESSIITDLQVLTSSNFLNPAFRSSLIQLNSFASLASTYWIPLDNIASVNSTSQDFTLLAFSNAHIAGSGVLETVNASVSAVPEPQTYALMLVGLGLVAWIARRRRSPQPFVPAERNVIAL